MHPNSPGPHQEPGGDRKLGLDNTAQVEDGFLLDPAGQAGRFNDFAVYQPLCALTVEESRIHQGYTANPLPSAPAKPRSAPASIVSLAE